MRWSGDDVREANPAGPGQDRSVIDTLLRTGQADLRKLAEVADELEARPQHHVAAFCQLPYPVMIEPGWHRLSPLEEHGLYAELSFAPCELTVGADGRLELAAAAPSREPRGPAVTQVVALFPVWGDRRSFHGRYLHHVERGTADNPEIVPQSRTWIQNRPMHLGDYESNFAASLIRQLTAGLRNLLPAYSIASLDEAPVPERLYSYFAMVAPGRVVRGGTAVPIINALLKRNIRRFPAVVAFDAVRGAMATRYRHFGRFEQQLFALRRLGDGGEVALALVGAISLLEWVVKALLVGSGGVWSRSWLAVRAEPSLDFMTDANWATLHAAREMRNGIVHEAPPARRSMTSAGMSAGRELPGPPGTASPEVVAGVLELAFRVFREANRRRIAIGEFQLG